MKRARPRETSGRPLDMAQDLPPTTPQLLNYTLDVPGLGCAIGHCVEYFCLILVTTLEAESILLIRETHIPPIRAEADHMSPQKYLSRSATPSRSDHGDP